MLIIALSISLLLPTIAIAESMPRDEVYNIFGVKSFKCYFDPGSIADYKNYKHIKIENFNEKWVLHFDSIDIKNSMARIIGNQGSTTTLLMVTPSGLHFIEKTGFGNLNFTTIFTKFKKNILPKDIYYAVHSRHLNFILSSPIPSQKYGYCKVWDI